jgi:type IV pilus assembly protein PilQ
VPPALGQGHGNVDQRTNTLLVDAAAAGRNSPADCALIFPVRRVLIESRIVIAQNNFSKALGVKFGLNKGNRIQQWQ